MAQSDRADAEAFALIAEHTRDLIVRLSTGGRITYVSPSVRRYGWAPEDLIGRFGHELVHPADAALARLAQSPVDVVLMDLRMPGLDGRGALERLRAEPGPNKWTPVQAFTADADAAAQGDLADFDGLVRKPIQPIELFAAVADASLRTEESDKNNKRKTLHAAV
ncbi:MAG: response regulator [Phenylobacterium sp.]